VKAAHAVEDRSRTLAAPRFDARQWIGRLDPSLLATIAVGAIVRFWGLGSQSLWFDEWLTTEAVSGSVGDIFRHVANREGIPPSYFLVMWGWVRVFGDGEAALRSLSVLVGIATIPVAYAIARELKQRRAVGRVAAVLVALNPMLVWYSQEARPYSLLALMGALSILTFARVWNRGGKRDVLVWSLVCAGAIAVHYYAIFLVVAEFGALLLCRRRRWRQVLLAAVPGATILALFAPVALEQRSHSPNYQWISSWSLDFRLSEAGRSALVGPASPRERLWVVVAGVALLAAGLVITLGSRAERSAAALLGAVAGAAVVVPLVTSAIGFDIFLSRYLMAALVPLVVAAAIGLGVRRGVWIGGVVIVALCAVWLGVIVAVARDPDLQKANWHDLAGVFATGSANRVLVMNLHGYAGNALYYYVDGARSLDDADAARVDEIDVVIHNAKDKPCDFLVGRVCSLLFLGRPLPEPLASQFKLVDRHELDQLTVDRYRADQLTSVTKAQLVAPGNPADALVLVRS
jgi:mannosyltransferase